jgi:ubiquinone/menaquinone biosynthesis C-methylase UbiE
MNQKEAWNETYRGNKNKWKMKTTSMPNILKGKIVLELGAGNGKTLQAILKQKPLSVTAIDFSEEAVKESSQRFIEDNIIIIKADATALPFKDEEFDVVVCYYILNNLLVNERKEAIEGIYRVLKRKGRVLFEDFASGDFREKEDKELVEKHTIKNKNEIICHFFDVNELKKLFEDFKSTKFTEKTSTPITHKSELKRKIISGIINK